MVIDFEEDHIEISRLSDLNRILWIDLYTTLKWVHGKSRAGYFPQVIGVYQVGKKGL